MTLTLKHAIFAERYGIPPEDGYVLPALFERAAEKVEVSASFLLFRALANSELGEYMAGLAKQVADEMRKENGLRSKAGQKAPDA